MDISVDLQPGLNGRSLSHDVPLQKASEASVIWDGGDKARTKRGKKARTQGGKKAWLKGRSISHDVAFVYATEAIMDRPNGVFFLGWFLGWFFWVGFGVVFNGLIVGVVSGVAGIAPARNAKRAGGPG